jgi:hypothetical protein
MLTKNLTAPVFNLKDVFGRMTDLNALTKVHREFQEKGLEMIFFFESKEQVILRSTFHREVSPIPLISDPGKVWYNAYGVEESLMKSTLSHISSFVQTAYKASKNGLPTHLMADGESISTMPAEFLVDHNLLLKKVLYSQRLNDRLAIDEIRQFAENGTTL